MGRYRTLEGPAHQEKQLGFITQDDKTPFERF